MGESLPLMLPVSNPDLLTFGTCDNVDHLGWHHYLSKRFQNGGKEFLGQPSTPFFYLVFIFKALTRAARDRSDKRNRVVTRRYLVA